MSRLTLLHISIIGAVVSIIVAVALYFTIITGAQDTIKTNQTQYDAVKARADKLPQAKRDLANAQKDEIQTNASYASYKVLYTPHLGLTRNRLESMMRVFWPNHGQSWPERFIATVRKHMAQQAKRYKITWLDPEVLQLPPYGPDPNAIDMGDKNHTLTYGPYTMQVRGRNYQSLMDHIRDWNTLHGVGVPIVEGVTLNGNSPNLVASYTVRFTCILEEDAPPTDPRVAGSGGGQGGGMGGFPGGPGGMMGGPPMMGGPGMMGRAGMGGPPPGTMGSGAMGGAGNEGPRGKGGMTE